MKPALTREEWERVKRGSVDEWGVDRGWIEHVMYTDKNGEHKAAAMLLHNQPFGFTREDVEWCRKAFSALLTVGSKSIVVIPSGVLNLANRIEALLPPKQNP